MRSLLFVPGDSERKLAKALASGADALILDLEDSVAPANRSAARTLSAAFVRETRSSANTPLLYVRINPVDGSDWEADLDAVMSARPDGIIMPKPNSGEDVHRLSIALGHAESQSGITSGATRILPIVTETPLSVLNLHTYVGASTRMIGMSWGAEDLGAVVGSLANRDASGRFTSPYRLVRDLCLMTAAAASVEPIDTVYVDFRNRDGLEAETREARRDGFTGKMAIHPDQVGPINAIFTPTDAEVTHARAVVAAFDGVSGVASLDGKMLDKPHLVLAEKVIARAKAAGMIT
ncbi:MAG TPA: CoA ester lyase [Hyphomicrobiaceae bacterium]|nr:CoA ester lyase [Hyphomicrobiaceae bacterium]